MCGIAGEFRFDNTPPDALAMTRMLARLARRGPDAEGQHADGPVRLGHRRLAIIDLSPRSRQPMVDAGTGTAAGYGLLHVEASRSWPTATGPLRLFARIDNLLDRDHVGSVIVNEGNGRFYEPGADRTWLLGLEWQFDRR